MANNSDLAYQKYSTPLTEMSLIRLKGAKRKHHFTVALHTDSVDSAIKTLNFVLDKEKREGGILCY